jgi:hypothetical protein
LESFALSADDSVGDLSNTDPQIRMNPSSALLLDGELADEEISLSGSEAEELSSWEELFARRGG